MSSGSWGAQPKGVGGFSSLYKDSRKKVTASSENYRCQKCLEVGHFTYECKGERKYVAKTSRTVMLKRRMEGDTKGDAKHGKQKKVEDSSSSGKLTLIVLLLSIALHFQIAAATVTAAAVTPATPAAAVRTTARRRRRKKRRKCQKRRSRRNRSNTSYACGECFGLPALLATVTDWRSVSHYFVFTIYITNTISELKYKLDYFIVTSRCDV